MTEPEPLIDVEDLQVAFGRGSRRRTAVSGVNLTIRPATCTAIVGESGSGKSVTARSLVGLVGADAHVSAGRMRVGETDARRLPDRRWRSIRGSQIGYILQDALVSLDPLRTIGAELREAVTATTGLRGDAARLRSIELLERAQLPDAEARLSDRPAELSGGLRQRALIAQAIAGDPQVLIADEPTTALDVSVQQDILRLFAELKADGIGLLLISHDLGVVADIADEVLVLQQGRVVESGPVDEVLAAPAHSYTRTLIDAVPRFDAARPAPAARPEAEVLVEAGDLVKTFARGGRSRRAVDESSLTIRRGRTLGLVGESGSGKTTISRIIAGLESPDSGTVTWAPQPEGRRAASRVQFVYQDPLSSFDPRFTIGRTLHEAIRLADPSLSPSGRRAQVVAWLERVGLPPEIAGRRALQLSGGQRQRVAIARALSLRPELLILDEPVSALDASVQRQVLSLLRELQDDTGAAFLLVSHDLGVIQEMSDDVVVLNSGRVVESGPAAEVIASPRDPYTRRLLAAVPTLRPVVGVAGPVEAGR